MQNVAAAAALVQNVNVIAPHKVKRGRHSRGGGGLSEEQFLMRWTYV
jgi:hypothetical protein